MLQASQDTYLVEFMHNVQQSVIISHTEKDLTELAQKIRTKRESKQFSGMSVYKFDLYKRKFTKMSIKQFIHVTRYHTELNVLLESIYL